MTDDTDGSYAWRLFNLPRRVEQHDDAPGRADHDTGRTLPKRRGIRPEDVITGKGPANER